MTLKQAIDFWFTSAQRNLSAAKDLFNTKHYVECLFFCHLAIEKAIKGTIVRITKDNPPPVHNLPYLMSLTKLKQNKKQKDLIREIDNFNLRARYDDYKHKFYKLATKDFTAKYLQETEETLLWLTKLS